MILNEHDLFYYVINVITLQFCILYFIQRVSVLFQMLFLIFIDLC